MIKKLTKEQIEKAVNCTESARQAALLLEVSYTSFIRYAKLHNLYLPNQGGKGSSKPWKDVRKIKLEDVLSNNTKMQSTKLKHKLFENNLKQEICEECGLTNYWNGKKLNLQLDHRDGNSQNNKLENLAILCPNCHSQTKTFCRGHGKNGATLKVIID